MKSANTSNAPPSSKFSRKITCYLCKRNFKCWVALQQHVETATRHADCQRCSEPFASLKELDRHLRPGGAHSERTTPSVTRPMRIIKGHTSPLAVKTQSINSVQLLEQNAKDEPQEYSGEDRKLVDAVYSTAYRLRDRAPTVESIKHLTKTPLSDNVISALLQAAFRLLPVDNTPEARVVMLQRSREKRDAARAAENTLCAAFTRAGHVFLTESQQKAATLTAAESKEEGKVLSVPTPDIKFERTTSVCGFACEWIEYKNYFGFRRNPFVHKRNKKQLKKYASRLGPGMVVYKLGYEKQVHAIENVMVFREEEVLRWLELQGRTKQL